ncbi:MAG: tetratricopeptide repeat protein [Anaerolineae bacterium]
MARRKKRKKQTQRGTGVNPRALQIIQRKLGGRRPDRAKVFRALLQEARRVLVRSDYETALELAEQVEQLAKSEDERQVCDLLLAEVYFERASTYTGQARLDDLELAVLLKPQEPLYRVHLARALEQDNKVDQALEHYHAASQVSGDSKIGYLWCVSALKAGRPLPAVDLSPAERNTLDIVQHLVSDNPESAQLTEPVLGGSLPLWRALAQMLTDEETAPVDGLETAASLLDGTGAAGTAYYYLGVAALRAGDLDTAGQALARAQETGHTSPGLQENLSCLSRAQAIQQAKAGNWRSVIDVSEPVLREVNAYPEPSRRDRVLAETVSLAHFHLGYDAAQAGDWATATHHWRQAKHYAGNRYLAQNLALAHEQQEDWESAAEAWRDMVRRRPRKENHPDYLDDNQVAGLWRHTAECYRRAKNPAEAITCLQNGLKYAPDDIEMRRELSEALIANEQVDAAENELSRILERDPENIRALVRLGQLYLENRWWRRGDNAVEMLKRALELDPDHEDARDVLGDHYIQQGNRYMGWGVYGQAAEQFRKGLEHLPDYPMLYAYLGVAERLQGNDEAAREHLLWAHELEPDRARTAGFVLHELLHMDAEEDVERLLPEIREMPALLPGFWINQGERVLECELETAWADQFFEEALALVGKPWVSETRAEVLVDIVEELFGCGEGTSDLGRRYRKRIEQEVPRSGAKEYIDSLMAAFEEHNWHKAERLLGKARHKARKAGEKGLTVKIDLVEEHIFASPPNLYDFLDQLFG